jgi:hypothetical protein
LNFLFILGKSRIFAFGEKVEFFKNFCAKYIIRQLTKIMQSTQSFYTNAYNVEFSTETWLCHAKVWKTPLKMCKTHGFSRLVRWVFQLFHAFRVWKSWKIAFELHKCLKFECRKKYIFTFPLDRIYSFEVNLFTVRKNILV